MFQNLKNRMTVVGSAVAAAVVSASPAFALDVDYSAAVTGITSQVTTALTAALPIMGIVLGIYAGVKLFKRFAK